MILSRVLCHSTAAFLLLTSACALPVGAHAQVSGNSRQPGESAAGSPAVGGASKLTFDAASIRPSSKKFVLNGFEFLNPVSDSAPPEGGLFSWNVQFILLIDFAYDLRGPQVKRQAWEALPKSVQQEWYTVEARATGNPTRADVRQMVRSMLEERFQFTGHVEKREGEVFALVVAKSGLGLKPHPEGTPCTLAASLMDEGKYPQAYPPYKGFPPHCGVFNRELSHSGERRLEMLDVTMQQIADSLGLPLAVIDHTGLEGRFDAVLDYGPNTMQQNIDPANEIGLPLLPVALEKQLGLKLTKQNAQVDVFVMDHIGTLSEN
jgi:uncharacterized protein (TIGR03435 family)